MENILTFCIVIAGILMYFIGVWLSGTFRLTNPFHSIEKEEKLPVRKICVISLAPNPDEQSAIVS